MCILLMDQVVPNFLLHRHGGFVQQLLGYLSGSIAFSYDLEYCRLSVALATALVSKGFNLRVPVDCQDAYIH